MQMERQEAKAMKELQREVREAVEKEKEVSQQLVGGHYKTILMLNRSARRK